LSDINITPLLDLAFVLLIIFVITTPMLDQSMSLNLPKGGQPETQKLDKKDVRTVEVSAKGEYKLGGQTMTLKQIEVELIRARRERPDLVVQVRGDEAADWGKIAAVMNICERNGITRFRPRMAPDK
jgi:biopolymer transport protein ExbD